MPQPYYLGQRLSHGCRGIALAGGLGGIAVGRGIEQIFPLLISKFFQLDVKLGWNLDAAVQGLAVGILTTLLFTLPPLLAIRKVRPALIMRRDMPDAKLTWRRRLAETRAAIATGGLILVGIAAIAGWLAESPRVGGYFAGGLLVSLIALAIVAWGLLRVVRVFLRRPPWHLSATTLQMIGGKIAPIPSLFSK
jgi:putative ABC transport system permease protein